MFGYWENWEENIRIIFWMIMFDVVWCLKKLYERVCNFVNLEIVNWGIHLVNNLSTLLYSPSKSLQFGGIKNEGIEVVQIPLNLSPSFIKNLPNKVIELLSLPLLYSPSFFKHLNTIEVRITSSSRLRLHYSTSHFSFTIFFLNNFKMTDLLLVYCNFVLYTPLFLGLTFCFFNASTE